MTLETVLGRGRSATVLHAQEGIAVKRFSDNNFLTALANYVLTGAPGPYGWSADAVAAAHHRRQLLSVLVEHWFGEKLRVANSLDFQWNEEARTYELRTEFVDGRHALLHHPFSRSRELDDLINNIMLPLQEKLQETGFDGAVWQAGKANPTATANFIHDGKGWVWIDLESGVPALFPSNPLALPFYIGKSLRHRRCLYDDVDISKLEKYLFGLSPELHQRINPHVEALAYHQAAWKALRRHQRGIEYQEKKGRITHKKAEWYWHRPFRWYAREGVRLSKVVISEAFSLPERGYLLLKELRLTEKARDAVKFVYSAEFRKKALTAHLERRIGVWEQRKQLSPEQAAELRSRLPQISSSRYFNDMGIHVLGLKILDWGLYPAALGGLVTLGKIDVATAAALTPLGGSVLRTVYSAGRMACDAASRKGERFSHAIALSVGWIPIFGNAAYPLQIACTGPTEDRKLAEFFLYDLSARFGRNIPIYGGPDSRTEHALNRLPGLRLSRTLPEP